MTIAPARTTTSARTSTSSAVTGDAVATTSNTGAATFLIHSRAINRSSRVTAVTARKTLRSLNLNHAGAFGEILVVVGRACSRDLAVLSIVQNEITLASNDAIRLATLSKIASFEKRRHKEYILEKACRYFFTKLGREQKTTIVAGAGARQEKERNKNLERKHGGA